MCINVTYSGVLTWVGCGYKTQSCGGLSGVLVSGKNCSCGMTWVTKGQAQFVEVMVRRQIILFF